MDVGFVETAVEFLRLLWDVIDKAIVVIFADAAPIARVVIIAILLWNLLGRKS